MSKYCIRTQVVTREASGMHFITMLKLLHTNKCPCGSVVEHVLAAQKVVGSIPREHILTINVQPECTVRRFG